MQKEELLSLLDQQALAAFEEAKRLALAHGGVVSPLHLMAALLGTSSEEERYGERANLLKAASQAIAIRFPRASAWRDRFGFRACCTRERSRHWLRYTS